MSEIVYVGSYGAGIGIYSRSDATLSALGTADTPDPSFLAVNRDRTALYACNELTDNSVSAFAIEPGGGLRALGSEPTGGTLPCHVLLHPAGYLLTANYGSGSVSVHPVRPDGSLGERTDLAQHEGHGPNPDRQEGPHAHEVRLAGELVVVVDLGLDALVGYRLDPGTGRLAREPEPFVRSRPGSGPRHAVEHPSGRWYVADELGSTVSIVSIVDGSRQVVDAVPASRTAGQNQPAGIALSGDRLYVSNRGADSITTFQVAPDGGLDMVAETPTGGAWPRHFAIVDDMMLVANQNSNTVTGLRLDPGTGVPSPLGVVLDTPSPTCVLPVTR